MSRFNLTNIVKIFHYSHSIMTINNVNDNNYLLMNNLTIKLTIEIFKARAL